MSANDVSIRNVFKSDLLIFSELKKKNSRYEIVFKNKRKKRKTT